MDRCTDIRDNDDAKQTNKVVNLYCTKIEKKYIIIQIFFLFTDLQFLYIMKNHL